ERRRRAGDVLVPVDHDEVVEAGHRVHHDRFRLAFEAFVVGADAVGEAARALGLVEDQGQVPGGARGRAGDGEVAGGADADTVGPVGRRPRAREDTAANAASRLRSRDRAVRGGRAGGDRDVRGQIV